MAILKAFVPRLKVARRCDGCGIIVGPDAPFKTGFEVREGPIIGFFHSRQCYERAREKAEKGGDAK